jgi:lipoprotein-anchoring transpeptidase ErfK/SrfK
MQNAPAEPPRVSRPRLLRLRNPAFKRLRCSLEGVGAPPTEPHWRGRQRAPDADFDPIPRDLTAFRPKLNISRNFPLLKEPNPNSPVANMDSHWGAEMKNIARSGLLLALTLAFCGTALAGPARLSVPAMMDSAALAADVPANLQRQLVSYLTPEAPGTIVVDTSNTYLYLVLNGGTAIRYGIGVGREGFTWSGVETISKKSEWPDWTPPAEMIVRQPYLPRFMAGGVGNPLGARAMYLGGTIYRIHGTNDPTTIGKHVSSGCIRLTNEDVADLYERVPVGARIVVLPNINRVSLALAR